MSKPYIVCPYCQSNLDYGESCDCQRAVADRSPDRVTERLARPLTSTISKAFGDPAVRAEYNLKAQRRTAASVR
jgi:hypothetical protein